MVRNVEEECPVESADILNVVGFQNFNVYSFTKSGGNPNNHDHVVKRKNGNHVTLLYDYTKKIIAVSVAFTKVGATGNTDGLLVLNYVQPRMYNRFVNGDVTVGTCFQQNRKLYKVLEIESNGSHFRCACIKHGVISGNRANYLSLSGIEIRGLIPVDVRELRG
eukprot:scaffold311215_cov62-Attheya_sp.AAC.1